VIDVSALGNVNIIRSEITQLAFMENYMKIMFPPFKKNNVLVWLCQKKLAKFFSFCLYDRIIVIILIVIRPKSFFKTQ
jgi:hypothetical protein